VSGIAGVYYLDGRPVERAEVERMTASIAHRGPDGAGVWCAGSVGFGHRLLRTTPESFFEKLPLQNQASDLVLTADARIDNRDELFGALDLDWGGRPRAEIADSELILAAYELWGEACVEKLLGDFAFAIWDGRRRLLFCARDHMGVKPLYYYRSGGVLVFGSEIKALFSLPEVPRRLNEVRVADYLTTRLEDKTITFYEGIVRLPPAHTLAVGGGQPAPKQYWQLDPSRELRFGSDEECAEAFRALFRQAVRCRLRSGFPVGSLLSGGLDSSSIVCVARDLLAEERKSKLLTFSATFDEVPDCDEQPFIRAVLAQGGVEPHFVRADRISPFVGLDRRMFLEDAPPVAPNLYIHWGLFGAAQERNVRVLLDGFEGDAVVSLGLERLADLARDGRWKLAAREISKLAHDLHRPAMALWWKRAIRPLLPRFVRFSWIGLRELVRPSWDSEGILSRRFARRVGAPDRFRALAPSTEPPSARESHWRRLDSGVMPSLREAANHSATAFGVELRYPYADRRLVEFCLALPADQKLREGWTRWVLRRAMEGVLPREIQWRGSKSDLSGSFNRGLREFERARLDEVLLRPPGALECYVDIPRLRTAYRRFLEEGSSRLSMAVWKAVTLALWLRNARLEASVPEPTPNPRPGAEIMV